MIGQSHLYEFIDRSGNLGELVLVLRSLKNGPVENWVLKSNIYGRCGATVRIPDAEKLIDLAEVLGLLEVKRVARRELVTLSEIGRRLLGLRHWERDRLTTQQGKLLLSKVVEKVEIGSDVSTIINMMSTDSKGDLWIHCLDKRIGAFEERVLRLLQQLKIARFSQDNISITKKDKDWLIDTLVSMLKMDEESLSKQLERQRKLGLIAEMFVLQKEKERLVNCGRQDLAGMARRVSQHNVAAGYDILSFDGPESGSFPDRFIEVKGTSRGQVCFYISRNEIELARSLGKNYWLYCVLNVPSKKSMKLVMIENPYEAIFEARELQAEPVSWKVNLSRDARRPPKPPCLKTEDIERNGS